MKLGGHKAGYYLVDIWQELTWWTQGRILPGGHKAGTYLVDTRQDLTWWTHKAGSYLVDTRQARRSLQALLSSFLAVSRMQEDLRIVMFLGNVYHLKYISDAIIVSTYCKCTGII